MMARLKRIARHAFYGFWDGIRLFPPSTLSNIDTALKMGTAIHGAKLHFVVEPALGGAPLFTGQSARDRALDIFTGLRLWDTRDRNGVLVYVLLADKAVEIVADRGLHAVTTTTEWHAICRAMTSAFHDRHFENGAVNGIHAINNLLIHHFRPQAGMAI